MSHSTDDEAEDVEPTLAPGTLVGEYEIGGLLGQGGFGSVYKAVHPLIGKSAAVKVLKQEFSAKPEMVSLFVSEAPAVNQIRHRNIIDIFSFGRLEDGRQYFVMELLEGMPLDKYLDAHEKLTLPQALPVLRQLSRALGAAHAAGITHRDIKPENVFLTFDEDKQVIPKLLDFGIAKLVVGKMSQHNTRSGTPIGTPLYMSPEQVHGRDVDPRSDIYSFGVMVFQLLTGRTPFSGDTMMGVMMQQVGEPAPVPSEVDPSLPAAIDASILHMLEKDPDARPPTIVAAMDALLQAAGVVGTGGATPSSLAPVPLPWAKTRLGAKTPGDATIAELGKSDTLIASEAAGSQAAVSVHGGRTVGLVAAAALGLGAIAAIMFVAMRPGKDAPAFSASEPAASVAAVETQAAEPEMQPSVTVSGEGSAAVSPTVKLMVKASPTGAEVWAGKSKLGLAGEDLALPRSGEEIVLMIKKSGYAPQTLKLVPSADIAEAVILAPLPKTQSEYGNF